MSRFRLGELDEVGGKRGEGVQDVTLAGLGELVAGVAHREVQEPGAGSRVRAGTPDTGRREGLTIEERAEIRRLRKENFELRRANEILKSASVFFARELDADRPR